MKQRPTAIPDQALFSPSLPESAPAQSGKEAEANPVQLWSCAAVQNGEIPAIEEGLPLLLYAEEALGGSLADAEERFFAIYRRAARLCGDGELLPMMADPAQRYVKYDALAAEGRGVRGLLETPSLFLAQLRAMLRVSAFCRVAPVLPFVSSTKELLMARALLETAMRELVVRGEAFDELLTLGACIETPAAALCCEALAGEVDFLLIDTDPLFAFALADPAPEGLLFASNEVRDGLFSLLRHITEQAHRKGRFVGITGRAAASTVLSPLLIEAGADALALPARALPQIRRLLPRRR